MGGWAGAAGLSQPAAPDSLSRGVCGNGTPRAGLSLCRAKPRPLPPHVLAAATQSFQLQARAAETRAGAALCVALTPDTFVTGWSSGDLRCYARRAAPPAIGLPGRGGGSGGSTLASPSAGYAGGTSGYASGPSSPTTMYRSTIGSRGASPAPSNTAAGAAAAPGPAPHAQLLWTVPGAHATPAASGASALCLSRRGRYVASGGAGGEVRLWDAASREMVCQLKHHTGAVTDLGVMLDDTHLLAASEDRRWAGAGARLAPGRPWPPAGAGRRRCAGALQLGSRPGRIYLLLDSCIRLSAAYHVIRKPQGWHSSPLTGRPTPQRTYRTTPVPPPLSCAPLPTTAGACGTSARCAARGRGAEAAAAAGAQAFAGPCPTPPPAPGA